jgi:hypothetical protein
MESHEAHIYPPIHNLFDVQTTGYQMTQLFVSMLATLATIFKVKHGAVTFEKLPLCAHLCIP